MEGSSAAPDTVDVLLEKKSIVILDFGGQYAHLLARRVRECGAFSEIHPPETKAAQLKDAAGIILSGGPQSVYEAESPQADPALLTLGIPVLGICYGHHWLAHALGGEVTAGAVKEYGSTAIEKAQDGGTAGALFTEIPTRSTVWMSHGDEVTRLPEGFRAVASSADCMVAAMEDTHRKIFGVQFHPEVRHTEHGTEILCNFVALTDHAPWSMTSYAEHIALQIKREIGDRKVFMLVSGGVDSTVAFTLLNATLGTDRVQGLLVDTGLMRKGEVEMIRLAFERLGIDNLRIEDASAEFLARLEGVFEPEAKRKIIGQTFLDVRSRVSAEMNLHLKDGWLLGQGTIYPDTIEPLKELYKDDVRRLGEEIGLPHELVWRHPFPGPGLGVRILCAESEWKIENEKLTMDIPATYAVLPVQSVGVQGDGRTYRQAVALFSNDPSHVAPEFLELATSIPNTHQQFNRVLQCTSHAAPPTFVFTPGTVTRERADLLREADHIVAEEMERAHLYELIWQFPVVLLPFGTTSGGQSIVLRPISSDDAMTANAVVLPQDVLQRMTDRIVALPGIDCVFLDLTNKPPGTIEWE